MIAFPLDNDLIFLVFKNVFIYFERRKEKRKETEKQRAEWFHLLVYSPKYTITGIQKLPSIQISLVIVFRTTT